MRAAHATIASPRPARRLAWVETPFLPISYEVRFAILAYMLAYRVIFPLLATIMNPGTTDLFALRFLAELLYTGLLAYPFIFYRREYGWLHPLVVPVLWELGKTLAKNPLSLILPFEFPLIDFTVEATSRAAVLSMPNYDLAWYRLKTTLIYIVAQGTYLVAFLFGPSFRVPRLTLHRPANVAWPAMVTIIGMLGIAAVFVVAKGGISEVLLAMRGGRRVLFDGYGQYIAAAHMAPIIALIWFAYEKNPFRNPVFLAGFVLALLAALLVTGSRSSVVLSGFILVLLWWWRSGRALILPTATTVLVGLVVIGGFGSIRQDWNSTDIDLSVFNPAQMGETIDLAYTEIEKRDNEDTALAAIVGADRKGFLWGRTYLNAATFWVPRVLWPDKPVGADVYNMWINFNDNKIGVAPPNEGTWGVPVDGQSEAFWNFGWLGVIIVFALMGMFHATLAKAAHVYRTVPIFWVFYLYTMIYVVGTSRSITEMLKVIVVMIAFAFVSGIVRWGQQAPGRESARAHGA
jgi:hypothetical protein